jgi:hypothetical protein
MKSPKTPKTLSDACDNIVELITQVSEAINQTDLFGEIHLENENGWIFDTCVNLKFRFPNGGIYDTGYSITPVFEEVKSISILANKAPVMEIVYYVQHEVITRGVWRYKDGSGEPDSCDIVDDLTTRSVTEAVKKLLLLNTEQNINQLYEQMAEDEMAEKDAEFDKEMAKWNQEMEEKLRDAETSEWEKQYFS